MSWLPILLLAGAGFGLAAWLFKLPRSGWALFGAALLFGLSGYALQGYPGYPGAPKRAVPNPNDGSSSLIDARREFFGATAMPNYYVTIADGFARKGKFEDAANMLGNAVAGNPGDAEAWVALGNALIDHADGTLTPPALYAFARAEQIAPNHPASAYFHGVGLLRSGEIAEARGIWAQLLADAPENATWQPQLADRVARLDELMQRMQQDPQNSQNPQTPQNPR